jgi:Arc/MetJ family transcription regulator
MPLSVELDHNLIDEARRVGRHKTPKAAITAALKEYVKKRKRLRILELRGKIDYDPDYDYKAARSRKAL